MLKKINPPVLVLWSYLILGGWVLLVLAFALAWTSPEQIQTILPFWCPIKALSHLACPGCGMTRAFIALAQFHLGQAWQHHPLSLFLWIFLVLAISPWQKRLETFYQKNHLYLGALSLVLIWWLVYRLIPSF